MRRRRIKGHSLIPPQGVFPLKQKGQRSPAVLARAQGQEQNAPGIGAKLFSHRVRARRVRTTVKKTEGRGLAGRKERLDSADQKCCPGAQCVGQTGKLRGVNAPLARRGGGRK